MDNSPCALGSGTIYAVAKHRVVATAPINHGRFSLSLVPGDYMLHANQRTGWCHLFNRCNAYRAVLAVAHQAQNVELEVPPPPSLCSPHYAPLAHPARVYHDPAGWTIDVPRRWHLVPFESSHGGVSAAGAQISNVRLPAPHVVPTAPIQAQVGASPARGIGLVIATDSEKGLVGESPGYIVMPPLPTPDQCKWSTGSALAGQAYIEILWFRGDHKSFVATVKVGPHATGKDLATVNRTIQSLRFGSARS